MFTFHKIIMSGLTSSKMQNTNPLSFFHLFASRFVSVCHQLSKRWKMICSLKDFYKISVFALEVPARLHDIQEIRSKCKTLHLDHRDQFQMSFNLEKRQFFFCKSGNWSNAVSCFSSNKANMKSVTFLSSSSNKMCIYFYLSGLASFINRQLKAKAQTILLFYMRYFKYFLLFPPVGSLWVLIRKRWCCIFLCTNQGSAIFK